MHNIVSLDMDRPRPPRALAVPRSGARILFFTGVRYCRDDEEEAAYPARYDLRPTAPPALSERGLDLTAH